MAHFVWISANNETKMTTNQSLIGSSSGHTQAVAVYVAYDISVHRRRNRLNRLLRGFGEPVQKSVFLCWVDAARQRRLTTLLDDFKRARHTGQERIDCVPARTGAERVFVTEFAKSSGHQCGNKGIFIVPWGCQ